ncbi:MAG: dTDP-4-dehydrorhamnose reductase [Dehalococcoidia bacterium]|nr:MAG: dTDP-4-dehydrorhamnose reductase [Dehalococcoidia bacterium]
MRILLTGAGGQLATDLAKTLSQEELIPLSHAQLDIVDTTQVKAAVKTAQPDVVINTAAFHRVDDCETEVGRAIAVNAHGVRNLALACQQTGAALLHLSTDHVFGGSKAQPYSEEDIPRPVNIYGVSKLLGEVMIRHILDRSYIVRSSGLFGVAGASGKGGNFVRTMLRLAGEGGPIQVVNDQCFSPTSTADLASKIAWLITTTNYGIWHITNAGEASWYDFAAKIFQLANLRPNLSPTTTADFGAKARRPSYSVLDHGRLRALGVDNLPPWEDALSRYLTQIEVVSPV